MQKRFNYKNLSKSQKIKFLKEKLEFMTKSKVILKEEKKNELCFVKYVYDEFGGDPITVYYLCDNKKTANIWSEWLMNEMYAKSSDVIPYKMAPTEIKNQAKERKRYYTTEELIKKYGEEEAIVDTQESMEDDAVYYIDDDDEFKGLYAED